MSDQVNQIDRMTEFLTRRSNSEPGLPTSTLKPDTGSTAFAPELIPSSMDDIPEPDISTVLYAISLADAGNICASPEDTHAELSSHIFDEELFAKNLADVPTPKISAEFRTLTLEEGETVLESALTAETSMPFPEEENDEVPNERTVTEYRAARMAEEKHRFLVWLDALYIWISPAYRKLMENELIALLKDSFDESITERKPVAFWKGVIAQLTSNSSNFIDMSGIRHSAAEVVFRNGVYDVCTQTMRPASPDDYFLMFNDITFDQESARNSGKVTEQFFEDFSGGEPEIQALAWAIIGAILSSGNEFKKYFVFYGASDTGKSVLGHVIERLVGEKNCSHFPLNRLSGFETAQLVGKKLNCNLDLSAVELSDLGVFKMLTGGGLDTIDCQKKYGRFVTLRTNGIKMLFATNALPKVAEDEDPTSFFGRMILLPFLTSVPTERKNLHLAKDLMEEKDYIIRKAMQAYRKLLDHNFSFPYCETAERIVAAHSKSGKSADPLDEFVRFDCFLSPEYGTNNESMYQVYLTRCCSGGSIPLSKNQFITNLRKKYHLAGGRGPRDPQGKRAHITRGIALCSEQEPQADESDFPE
ncbi:MAG: phage/plasmid primase, P4 family [Butyricicoccus sp.]|nr:phage/plasmid primase, P4 family [Butyricicoccus sp.]